MQLVSWQAGGRLTGRRRKRRPWWRTWRASSPTSATAEPPRPGPTAAGPPGSASGSPRHVREPSRNQRRRGGLGSGSRGGAVVTQGSGGPAGGCVTETALVVYLWQRLGFWRPLRSELFVFLTAPTYATSKMPVRTQLSSEY
jgi:hypothetical protein